MARIRTNNVFGDAAVLTDTDTTLSSPGLADLPAISSPDIAIIVLDPDRTSGAAEIVHVTAHTASATTATILRGQEGTTARAHAADTPWIHTTTKNDWDEVAPVGNLWVISKSSSQTLGNNTVDTVTFDTTNVDGGGSVVDLANDRFVVPGDGMFMAVVHWLWESSSPAPAAYTTAWVNGTDVMPLVGVQGSPTSFQRLNGILPFELLSGDFITMVINPGAVSGVTARGNASSHLRTTFSLIRIA